jgi:hypothetical protein
VQRDQSVDESKNRVVTPLVAFVVAAGLLVASAPAAGPAEPRRLVAESGLTRAELTFWEQPDRSTRAPRIRIERSGRQVFTERIPPHPLAVSPGYAVHVSDSEGWFAVRDLDGDREPEVAVVAFWSGAYCCAWWRVYRFDGRTYRPSLHWWGSFGTVPALRDLNRDGRPELVSYDDRFEALTAHVAVFRPVQIWSYAGGRFTDVTRRHRRQVDVHARHLWGYYLSHRRNRTARYVLAAWAAEQYLLGRPAVVERGLSQALRRGDLVQRIGGPRDPKAYLRALKRFLRRTGYLLG